MLMVEDFAHIMGCFTVTIWKLSFIVLYTPFIHFHKKKKKKKKSKKKGEKFPRQKNGKKLTKKISKQSQKSCELKCLA